MFQKIALFLQLSICTFGYLFTTSNSVLAQVTSDGTVNTQVNQNGGVAEITGGETRDGNLFHSFQDFSVPANNEAFFDNANDISNIFSRVTGGNISNIDGLIRANGSASLFLINPAGIIFGEGASLDIGGSFYGSSASSVLFEDGEFSAADLENPPLLTINAPIGLGFRDTPGDIVNSSNTLSISTSETLAFIGGNVTFDSGIIFAPGANIAIGGLTGAGTVAIDNKSLSFPETVRRGNVSIRNSSGIIVQGDGGGSININANNFELLSGSLFFAGIGAGLGTPETQGGNITINAQENLEIDSQGAGVTAIGNFNDGTGNLGDISITARNISFKNGGNISNFNRGQGNIGKVDLVATENITFDGTQGTLGAARSGIQNFTLEAGQGNVSPTNITAQNLSLTNGASIQSSVSATADSGDINLNIADTIRITGTGEVSGDDGILGTFPSDVATEVFSDGIGDAGDININTQNLTLSNSGEIQASTTGQGNAGDINITASTINIEGGGDNNLSSSTINSSAFSDLTNNPDAIASGGNIQINTDILSLRDGGSIDAFKSGDGNGNGGSVIIDATDSISIDGTGIVLREGEEIAVSSGIFVGTTSNAVGSGGDIQINTPRLSLANEAQINAVTRGRGNAGDISIFADDSIELAGNSLISAGVDEGGIGNGGNLTIETNQLTIDDGADILANTRGEGDAGNISIFAADSIELENGFIFAIVSEEAIGNGGNLTIETNQLSIRNEGQILTDTRGQGDAGSLSIRATDSIELTGSKSFISAGVESNAIGNGGNLNLETGELTVADSGEITVESLGEGTSGNLTINANSIQLDNGKIDAATPVGEGGSINLRVAKDIILQGDSSISAQAFNNANGGNLNIDTRFIVAFPNGNSNIIANAEQGNGGNINISAESLFGIQERSLNDSTNDINASSEFSLDGSITINTPDLNPVQGATELPNNVVVPEETTAQTCQANRETAAKNSLTIEGRGGIPAAPDLPLDSGNIAIAGEINPTSSIPKAVETSQGKIQPARGIKVTQSGKVILTAYRTDNSGERIPEGSVNCGI